VSAQNDSHAADLQRVAEISDPVTRAREAGALLEQCARATEALAEARKNAVIEMHEGGMTHREIAKAIGVSKPRVGQLAGSGWTHTVVAKRTADGEGR
jgi:DNA-directed RNA polymerase specialized sigma24 family protein